MSGVHDVISEYKSILELNVEDPNSSRRSAGTQWIYDDLPAATIGPSHYPRISVLSFSCPVESHEIGTYRQRQTVRVEIQIRVPRTKWNGMTPPEFLNDLSLDVMEALRLPASIASLLSQVHVFRAVLEAENTIVADDVLIRQLIYKNTLVR